MLSVLFLEQLNFNINSSKLLETSHDLYRRNRVMICNLSLHQPDFGILRPFILTFLHVICVPVDLMHVYTPIHTWLSSIPLEQFSLFPSSVWTHQMSHGQRFWWTSFLNWSAGFHFWKTGDIVHYDGYLVFTRDLHIGNVTE